MRDKLRLFTNKHIFLPIPQQYYFLTGEIGVFWTVAGEILKDELEK